MGLFDNIIGTANDGEAAVDMDTIIENISKWKLDDIKGTDEASESSGLSGTGETGNPIGWSRGTSDDKKDDKKKKEKKWDKEIEQETEEKIEIVDIKEDDTKEEWEILDITEIDIGWDMSVIDITDIEEIVEIIPLVDATQEVKIIEPVTETVKPLETQESTSVTPADPVLSDINPDTMPTEPVISLLDITEPTPTISILDMGDTKEITTVPNLIVSAVAPPVINTPEPLAILPTPLPVSLGDKIGGFADELRGLKAADEILLQEKQDAKRRLEDAKKAIEDAEIAIDVEIQRIRDDEAAIDDTLASLKRR